MSKGTSGHDDKHGSFTRQTGLTPPFRCHGVMLDDEHQDDTHDRPRKISLAPRERGLIRNGTLSPALNNWLPQKIRRKLKQGPCLSKQGDPSEGYKMPVINDNHSGNTRLSWTYQDRSQYTHSDVVATLAKACQAGPEESCSNGTGSQTPDSGIVALGLLQSYSQGAG